MLLLLLLRHLRCLFLIIAPSLSLSLALSPAHTLMSLHTTNYFTFIRSISLGAESFFFFCPSAADAVCVRTAVLPHVFDCLAQYASYTCLCVMIVCVCSVESVNVDSSLFSKLPRRDLTQNKRTIKVCVCWCEGGRLCEEEEGR